MVILLNTYKYLGINKVRKVRKYGIWNLKENTKLYTKQWMKLFKYLFCERHFLRIYGSLKNLKDGDKRFPEPPGLTRARAAWWDTRGDARDRCFNVLKERSPNQFRANCIIKRRFLPPDYNLSFSLPVFDRRMRCLFQNEYWLNISQAPT